MRLLIRLMVCLGIVGASFAVSAQAQDTGEASPQAASLAGVDGVYVLVHPMKPELEADGLYRTAIEATAERALTAAGIPILDAGAVRSDPRQPHLCITITSTLTGAGLHAYSLMTTFKQNVALLPDPSRHVLATTWEAKQTTGAVARGEVEWITDEIEAALAAFVADYRAVNARSADAGE